jgi:hypothetical protein
MLSLTIGKYFFMLEFELQWRIYWGVENVGYAIERYLTVWFLHFRVQKPIGIRGVVKSEDI